MKRNARQTTIHHADGRLGIPGLLGRKGYDDSLTFFCTLCVFSLD